MRTMRALNSGVDLQGVCLYPCIDIPDWNTGEMAQIGIFDLSPGDTCDRLPCDPYIAELRAWQRRLDGPEQEAAADPADPDFGVQLDEVQEEAREWEERTPGWQTVGGRPGKVVT